MSPRPYNLVPDTLSKDTIACLKALLDEADRGNLIGIAFGAMLTRGRYWVNSAGEVDRHATFARGMVAELDAELHEIIQQAKKGKR